MINWILVLFFISHTLWANPGYWECTSLDSEQKQWVMNSIYKRAAATKAYEACKKDSNTPRSCQIDPNCDDVPRGSGMHNQWQCTALDMTANAWTNTPHANQDSAALNAQSLCRAHSKLPETCYVNDVSCKKTNTQGH